MKPIAYIVTNKGELPGVRKANKDGSSDFSAFNVAEIPSFVCAMDGFVT